MGDIGETIRKFKSLNFKNIIISVGNKSNEGDRKLCEVFR